MKNLKIALFTYNFPHRKTIDFIQEIYKSGYKLSLILSANFVKIKSVRSAFSFPKQDVKISINELAIRHNIPVLVVDHNSQKTIHFLKEYHINFGIIAGARVLNKAVCESLKYGILNFHPGLLPFVRGLDSILWSIEKGYPVGVTAHLINEQIDAGFLVYKKILNIEKTDNIYSIYEKNYQLQLDLIPISLNLIINNTKFPYLQLGKYNRKMSYSKQLKLIDKIHPYICNQSTKHD